MVAGAAHQANLQRALESGYSAGWSTLCGCSAGAPPLSAPARWLDNHFDPPPSAWPVVTTTLEYLPII